MQFSWDIVLFERRIEKNWHEKIKAKIISELNNKKINEFQVVIYLTHL